MTEQNPDLVETGPTNPAGTDFETGPTAPTEGFVTEEAQSIPHVPDYSGFEEYDKPAKMTKHQTVMHLDSQTGGGAIYQQASDDPNHTVEAISMHGDVFDDLGRPRTITVTVRAGDHLN